MLSYNSLPPTGWQNSHPLAVLGDSPPSDLDVLADQELHDLLVRERTLCVLVSDELPDFLSNSLSGDIFSMKARDASVEEVLEFEDPVGTLNVLVRRHATHSGLVDTNLVGHLAKDEWLELLNPVLKKPALPIEDAGHHLMNGPLSLEDALDQEVRRLQALLDVGLVLLG